jgi:mycothiol synthase
VSAPESGPPLRPPVRGDVRAIVDLAIAVDVAQYGEPDFTEEDVLADWEAPRFDPGRDAWVAAGPEGRLSGYATVWEKDPGRELTSTILVHPEDWATGVGERLLAATEARAAERIRAAGSSSARLATVVPSVSAARIDLVRTSGYRHTRTYVRMDIDLTGREIRRVEPPGIEIRRYRPGVDDRALHEAIEESFADHFRHVREPHEEWMALRTRDPRFNPELWFVAWDGAQAAGGILGYDLGDICWIRELGVRRAWRRRGLGTALLLRSFEDFRSRGRYKVCLGVDSDNAYQATRLYERAGMVVGQEHEFWEKQVEAAP